MKHQRIFNQKTMLILKMITNAMKIKNLAKDLREMKSLPVDNWEIMGHFQMINYKKEEGK